MRQHRTDAILAGICVQQEGAAKVWKCQDWGHGELLFELLECALTCHIPCKGDYLLSEVMEGLSYGCEIWHESTVVTGQHQKLLNLKLVVGMLANSLPCLTWKGLLPHLVPKSHAPYTALQIDKGDIWWISVSGPIVPVIPVIGVALSGVPQIFCRQQ